MQLELRIFAMSSLFLPLALRARTGKAFRHIRAQASLSKQMVSRLHSQAAHLTMERPCGWQR